MLSNQNLEELQTKCYTVVSDVLTPTECDHAIGQYREWLSQFKDGEWPFSVNSLLQRYNTGNMEPTWYVRLKSKKVFAQIWQTDKLLSSVDAIAIGRPPEDGDEDFHELGDHWLHLDQNPSREGLHAYQGGVYLEEACEDDWTLEVMEGSHLHFEEFFQSNLHASSRAEKNNYYQFLPKEITAMEEKGCAIVRVPVPKGGMVLWDSRLVHANARPIKGRANPGRWRFVVFVSMTPAIWATKEDLKKKEEAHSKACMTTHWSSQGVNFFGTSIPSFAPRNVDYPKKLPEIACSKEAKLISGALWYNFKDGNPNGDEFKPKWKKQVKQVPAKVGNFDIDTKRVLLWSVGIVFVASAIGFVVIKMKSR